MVVEKHYTFCIAAVKTYESTIYTQILFSVILNLRSVISENVSFTKQLPVLTVNYCDSQPVAYCDRYVNMACAVLCTVTLIRKDKGKKTTGQDRYRTG